MVAPLIVPVEREKKEGDWSVIDLKTWMVIRWPGLLGLNTTVDLPPEILAVLRLIYPELTNEGVAVELIQVSIDYGLNEIPSATAQVALGQQADNVKILSAIHYLIKHLKMFLSVSIYAQVENTSGSGLREEWPINADGSPKEFRIFDGRITGSGFLKTPQGVEFRCSIVHWLSDLNFSSTLSRSSSPQNPGQISFDANVPNMPNSGARLPALFNEGHGSSLTQAMPLINSDTLLKDLWGKTLRLPNPVNKDPVPAIGVGGLKQWFTEVCKNDRINWRLIMEGACGEPSPPSFEKNVEALAALARIEPLADGYLDGAPLAMDNRPGIENIAAQLATQIGLETAGIHNNTIWDKLVGQFGVALQFALVPQVEKALVVPLNPGLRKHWATIFANDYDYYERSDFIPRPLRGVGLFVGKEFSAGGHVSLNNLPVYNTVGAYYENPNRKNGLVIWKEAPRWLSTVVLPHMYLPTAQGLPGANALNVNQGQAPKQVPPKCKFEEAKKGIWCDYARGLYVQEILRGRQGRLSGRLRFDIAPGSIVRIEEPEEPFVLKALGGKKTFIFAQVLRVSCVLNSENKKAGTAIQFAFSRDEEENQDDSYSVGRHPIWKHNWYGAPLVNELEFYPGGFPGISPPEEVGIKINAGRCNPGNTLP